MMRIDPHPFHQVETVGIETLHARIEREGRALLAARLFHQPIEEETAKTRRSVGSVSHEIVHVERPAGKQKLHDAVARDRAHRVPAFQKRETVAFPLLPLHLPDEFPPLAMMRAQFRHHRMAAPDLRRRARDRDRGRF